MTIHIGFTGSRHQMPIPAKLTLTTTLNDIYAAAIFSSAPIVFHHGDCVNSDVLAAGIAKALGFIVHGHPPFDDKLRAFFQNNVTHAPKNYLDRNHDIVDVSRILIATPATEHEVLRSGTWATIRYARSLNRELCIIYPDGKVRWENVDSPNERKAPRA